ncbi:hypothetical protein CRG98_030589 [Punica granatum]|uniref:Uncharacterized protein n=1 Tax=Punica granatum TaxID=22663 RepID=A0A2I0IYB4_PUNGR|nr:hypothetical protein CRG98_030589 [Punica granatum]
MGLGWACKEREMGRGPLAGGRSGSPGTAATAVLALGRRDFGRFGENRENHDLGISGPAGIASSRRALPDPTLIFLCFFF